ncbi:MAG: hypothetical protein ACJ72D_13410 [Marmoricola sp.]
MIRRVLLAAVLAFLLLGAGAGASVATANDDPPPIGPPGFTPPVGDPSDPPLRGPTYVITPGVGGSELPAPSDPEAVRRAKHADSVKKPAGRQAGAGGTVSPRTQERAGTSAETAGRQTPFGRTASTTSKVEPLLRAFAAVVAMLVLYEVTAVRRAVFDRRRRGAGPVVSVPSVR